MTDRLKPLRFQSTLPRRERPSSPLTAFSFFAISIHAPAKGATMVKGILDRRKIFQSTLPRRERRLCSHVFLPPYEFQSTLPRRERHCQMAGCITTSQFQSTLPRRERPEAGAASKNAAIFQSTLPRRERRLVEFAGRRLLNFNPRSREGSDLCFLLLIVNKCHFNPRSREGSDLQN